MKLFLNRVLIVLAALSKSLLMAMVSLLAIAAGPGARRLQRPLLLLIGVQSSGDVFFGRRTILYSPNRLFLGSRVAIGDCAHIACHAPIYIGDDFLAAPGLYLNSGEHNLQTLEGFGKPIRIGARVWCGVRVTICSGVEIGDDVVIAAGAVVVDSVPSGCVIAGVPAKQIKTLNRDTDQIISWARNRT